MASIERFDHPRESLLSIVEIHYTRPPDRVTIFRQAVVHRDDTCVVTLLERADLPRPVTVGGRAVLESGAPAVWFTFPGLWHDIGRFHTVAGEFTGYYANVLTPVRFVTPLHWETTDLCLDVWLDDRGAALLDEDELEAAVHIGAVTSSDAARADAEARSLMAAAAADTWPPAICRHWTLERARAARRRGTRGDIAV